MNELDKLPCTFFVMQTIALDPAANVNLAPRVHISGAPKGAASHQTRRHAILSGYVENIGAEETADRPL